MDTGKLFRIITDLLTDEDKLAINGKIAEIKNDFAANSPEGFSNGKEKITALIERIEKETISITFTSSEDVFLKRIGGFDYFGKELINKLNSIFNSPGYEIVTNLDDFINQRNSFIEKIRRLSSDFTELGLQDWRPDKYEIGLIIPEDMNSVDQITETLKEFESLLSGISEATKKHHENIIINRYSNGSGMFFSPQDAEVALKILEFLSSILTVWVCIEEINSRVKKNDEDTVLTAEAKEGMKKVLEAEAQRVRKRILEELPNQIMEKLNPGRDYEIRNKITFSINAVFHWIQLGVQIDVTPIRIQKSEEEASSPGEQEKSDKFLKTNSQLERIYQLPKEQRMLPFELPQEKIEKEQTEVVQEKKSKKRKKRTLRSKTAKV